MSESKHTRGPWKYGFESADHEWAIVTDTGGSIIANVNTETGPDATSAPATRKMPAEANARLIAFAPDMLALLESFCTENPPIDPMTGKPMTFKQWVRGYSDRILAKAKGE